MASKLDVEGGFERTPEGGLTRAQDSVRRPTGRTRVSGCGADFFATEGILWRRGASGGGCHVELRQVWADGILRR